jgi:hypothetical protein
MIMRTAPTEVVVQFLGDDWAVLEERTISYEEYLDLSPEQMGRTRVIRLIQAKDSSRDQ